MKFHVLFVTERYAAGEVRERKPAASVSAQESEVLTAQTVDADQSEQESDIELREGESDAELTKQTTDAELTDQDLNFELTAESQEYEGEEAYKALLQQLMDFDAAESAERPQLDIDRAEFPSLASLITADIRSTVLGLEPQPGEYPIQESISKEALDTQTSDTSAERKAASKGTNQSEGDTKVLPKRRGRPRNPRPEKPVPSKLNHEGEGSGPSVAQGTAQDPSGESLSAAQPGVSEGGEGREPSESGYAKQSQQGDKGSKILHESRKWEFREEVEGSSRKDPSASDDARKARREAAAKESGSQPEGNTGSGDGTYGPWIGKMRVRAEPFAVRTFSNNSLSPRLMLDAN